MPVKHVRTIEAVDAGGLGPTLEIEIKGGQKARLYRLTPEQARTLKNNLEFLEGDFE